MTPEPSSAGTEEEEETGFPGLSTWRGVYLFVSVVFAVLVLLMILLERTFA